MSHKYVSGLKNLTVHYSPIYKKRIYVLGEQHVKDVCPSKYQSMSGFDLFFYLLDSSSELIDVFIETEYDPAGKNLLSKFIKIAVIDGGYKGISDSYMNDIENKLVRDHCFQYHNDNKCKIYKDHVRFHAVDIRSGTSEFIEYVSIVYMIQGALIGVTSNDSTEIENLKYYIKTFPKYKNYGATSTSIKKGVINSLTELKIYKQISNIDDKYSDLKNILTKKIDNIINQDYSSITYDKVYNSLLYGFNNCINKRNINCHNNWYIFNEAYIGMAPTSVNDILDTAINMMDIYLISRVFRKFRHVPGHLNGESKNIIIYVGDEHGENYRKTLDDIGFFREFQAENVDKGCLDISGLPKMSVIINVENCQKIEQLCKKLRESNYDTSILDSQDKIIRNTFIAGGNIIKQKVNNYILDKQTNYPLGLSIYNHNKGNIPIAQKISGIGRVFYLTYGDKKIYLFSDETHSLEYSCDKEKNSQDFHIFMRKFLDNADRFIDFFSEYAKYSRPIDDSYLTRTEGEFGICSSRSARSLSTITKCPHNTRLHYGDPRYFQDINNNLLDFFIRNNYKVWTSDEKVKYVKDVNEYISIIHDKNKFNNFFMHHIKNSKILSKELSKVPQYMATIIINSIIKDSFSSMINRSRPFRSPAAILVHFRSMVSNSSSDFTT